MRWVVVGCKCCEGCLKSKFNAGVGIKYFFITKTIMRQQYPTHNTPNGC